MLKTTKGGFSSSFAYHYNLSNGEESSFIDGTGNKPDDGDVCAGFCLQYRGQKKLREREGCSCGLWQSLELLDFSRRLSSAFDNLSCDCSCTTITDDPVGGGGDEGDDDELGEVCQKSQKLLCKSYDTGRRSLALVQSRAGKSDF